MSIQLKSVTKEYQLGKTTVNALRGVSMQVKQGEFVALVGPSGSGKSTALHIMGALDRPTSGEVWIHDTHVNGRSDKQLARLRREQIGFIFQSFHLIPVLSVYSNVEFPLLCDFYYRLGLPSLSPHRQDRNLRRHTPRSLFRAIRRYPFGLPA